MKCVRCGTELKDGDKFCLGCGFEVGKEYIPEKTQETLEDIYEMPVEVEPAEEMEIDNNTDDVEVIDGSEVHTNYYVGESNETVKKSKKINYIIIISIILILIITLLIGFNYKKIVCLFKDCKGSTIIKNEDKKKNIINNITTPYSFDSKFIFRIKDIWKDVSPVIYGDNLDNIADMKKFEKDSSEFKLIKYVFNDNSIDYYLNLLGEEKYDIIDINKIKYNYLNINDKEEYIITTKDSIYVFSFIQTSKNDINDILNTVVYYK